MNGVKVPCECCYLDLTFPAMTLVENPFNTQRVKKTQPSDEYTQYV